MRTDMESWYKAEDGNIDGVVTGFARWQGFDVKLTKIIVVLLAIFTAVGPFVVIYIVLSCILPRESEALKEDVFQTNRDLNKKYEKLKRKVEEMENELFDKEKEWDEKFTK